MSFFFYWKIEGRQWLLHTSYLAVKINYTDVAYKRTFVANHSFSRALSGKTQKYDKTMSITEKVIILNVQTENMKFVYNLASLPCWTVLFNILENINKAETDRNASTLQGVHQRRLSLPRPSGGWWAESLEPDSCMWLWWCLCEMCRTRKGSRRLLKVWFSNNMICFHRQHLLAWSPFPCRENDV